VNGCPDSVYWELTMSNGSDVTPVVGYMNTSGYQDVIPGADNFEVVSSSDTAKMNFSSTLANGGSYSVFTNGLIQNPSVFIVTDNLVTPSGNNASVRLVNNCPDAGSA